MEGWFENKTAATLSELEFNGTYFAGSSIIHQKLELCVEDEKNARVVCGSLEEWVIVQYGVSEAVLHVTKMLAVSNFLAGLDCISTLYISSISF